MVERNAYLDLWTHCNCEPKIRYGRKNVVIRCEHVVVKIPYVSTHRCAHIRINNDADSWWVRGPAI